MRAEDRTRGLALAATVVVLITSLGLLQWRLSSPAGRLRPVSQTTPPASAEGWGLEVVPVEPDLAPPGWLDGLVIQIGERRLSDLLAAARAQPWSLAPTVPVTAGYVVIGRAPDAQLSPVPAAPSLSLAAALSSRAGPLIATAAYLTMALLALWRRPDEPLAQALLHLGLALWLVNTAQCLGTPLQLDDLRRPLILWLTLLAAGTGTLWGFVAVVHLGVALAPWSAGGRWTRPAYALILPVTLGLTALSQWLQPEGLAWLFWLRRVYGLLGGLAALVVIGAAVQRYRRARRTTALELRQMRWLIGAALATFGLYLGLSRLPMLLTGQSQFNTALLSAALLTTPAALAFSIARYRLFDIDYLLSRTLVYGGLTLLIAGGYAAAVGGAGLWATANPALPELVVAGVVAVALEPARQWLQQAVERLVYGERGDPDRVARRLSRRLQASYDPATVLAEVAQTVARSLKLTYVALEAADSGGPGERLAAEGQPSGLVERFPLRYAGVTWGALVAAPRPGEPRLAPRDRQVLEQLTQPVSVALQAAQTLRQLQHSREALVTAREAERRRLQRWLQTEVAPALAGLVLSADAIGAALQRGRAPAALTPELARLRDEFQQVTARVRALVHALPPADQ